MKFFNILFLIFIDALSSYFADASTGESDVIRVFNPNRKITPERMKYILKRARLEDVGFTKSEETRYETDENGDKVVKKITYYMVQDDCSKKERWMKILSESLPKKVYDPVLEEKMSEEIDQRINGRATEYCRFGLEIHLRLCGEKEKKRFVWSPATRYRRAIDDCTGTCACCNNCGVTEIKYKSLDVGR